MLRTPHKKYRKGSLLRQCYNNRCHKWKNILHCDLKCTRSQTFGCKVVLSVSDDHYLCTDKVCDSSHPVMVSASTMVQKPALNNITITAINKMYGMFARMLYTSCIKTSTFFENPQIDPTTTPTERLIAAQINAREMEILDPNHTASNVDCPVCTGT